MTCQPVRDDNGLSLSRSWRRTPRWQRGHLRDPGSAADVEEVLGDDLTTSICYVDGVALRTFPLLGEVESLAPAVREFVLAKVLGVVVIILDGGIDLGRRVRIVRINLQTSSCFQTSHI